MTNMLKKQSIVVGISLVILLLAFAGCERSADVVNVQEYSHKGVSFSLPGNWQVSEDVTAGTFRYIIVETPGDALFMLNQYSNRDSMSLGEIVEAFPDSIGSEMPFGQLSSLDRYAVDEVIGGKLRKGIKNKINIAVLGQTVPHEQTYFKLPQQRSDIFLITQVADEDKSLVDHGFELILDTFRYTNNIS